MNNSLILYMKLYLPKVDPTALLDKKSWLLTAASRLKDHDVYAFAAPSMSKNPNLGRVFSDILPRTGNEFTLELGVTLPDLFPNIGDSPDFQVEVSVGSEQFLLCGSNRMTKLRYLIGNEYCHVIVPGSSEGTTMQPVQGDSNSSPVIAGSNQVKKANAELLGVPESVHAEFLKTTVTTRFVIHGEDVEDALSKELKQKISLFVDLLNRFALSSLMTKKEQPGITTPIYDTQTFDSMYMIIQGVDEKKLGLGRIGLNLTKLTLNPDKYSFPEAEKLKAYLNGKEEIDEARRFLLSAKCYLDGGLIQVSLLHLAIAAEIATTRFVYKRMLESGVSKTKLEELSEELTFSKMLNIDIFVVSPPNKKPDRELVGKINEIRRMRNKLMHEGHFIADSVKMREMFLSAKDFMAFLEECNKI